MRCDRMLAGMESLCCERKVPVMAKVHVGSIVLRVDNLQRQTEFWAAALDYIPREEQSDDFVLLRPRDGVGPNLSLDRVRRDASRAATHATGPLHRRPGGRG